MHDALPPTRRPRPAQEPIVASAWDHDDLRAARARMRRGCLAIRVFPLDGTDDTAQGCLLVVRFGNAARIRTVTMDASSLSSNALSSIRQHIRDAVALLAESIVAQTPSTVAIGTVSVRWHQHTRDERMLTSSLVAMLERHRGTTPRGIAKNAALQAIPDLDRKRLRAEFLRAKDGIAPALAEFAAIEFGWLADGNGAVGSRGAASPSRPRRAGAAPALAVRTPAQHEADGTWGHAALRRGSWPGQTTPGFSGDVPDDAPLIVLKAIVIPGRHQAAPDAAVILGAVRHGDTIDTYSEIGIAAPALPAQTDFRAVVQRRACAMLTRIGRDVGRPAQLGIFSRPFDETELIGDVTYQIEGILPARRTELLTGGIGELAVRQQLRHSPAPDEATLTELAIASARATATRLLRRHPSEPASSGQERPAAARVPLGGRRRGAPPRSIPADTPDSRFADVLADAAALDGWFGEWVKLCAFADTLPPADGCAGQASPTTGVRAGFEAALAAAALRALDDAPPLTRISAATANRLVADAILGIAPALRGDALATRTLHRALEMPTYARTAFVATAITAARLRA